MVSTYSFKQEGKLFVGESLLHDFSSVHFAIEVTNKVKVFVFKIE